MDFDGLLKLIDEENLEPESIIKMLLDKLEHEAVEEVKTAKGWLEHWEHHAFGLEEATEACGRAKLIWHIRQDLLIAHNKYVSEKERIYGQKKEI